MIVVRLFKTVRARQVGRYGMVLPTFVHQGLAGQDIPAYGNGEQTRCFADVSEVAESPIRLVCCEEARRQVFNAGSDSQISLDQLAERVRRAGGGRSPIVRPPYEQAYAEGFEDLGRRVHDVHKLERAIGFRPRASIEMTVQRIVGDVEGREDG